MTDRGRVVARLVPGESSALERLIAEGLVEPAPRRGEAALGRARREGRLDDAQLEAAVREVDALWAEVDRVGAALCDAALRLGMAVARLHNRS